MLLKSEKRAYTGRGASSSYWGILPSLMDCIGSGTYGLFVAAVHSYGLFVHLGGCDWYAFHMYRLSVPHY
jgi:hypothetical protein